MQWTQRADREATGTTTFYQQVTLFDVHEHNSDRFVLELVKKTTTRKDLFFEHFQSLNIVYLSKYHISRFTSKELLNCKRFHLAHLLLSSDHFPRIENH
jgi:hypothetical protein